MVLEPTPPESAHRRARTLARLVKHVDTALGTVELSPSQYRVLAFLAEDDAEMASALAAKLGVSRPSVTALIDGLESRGLVERRASHDDRRRVEHCLTPEGHRALVSADSAVSQRIDSLLAHLDARTQVRAATGLEALGDALDLARVAYLDAAREHATRQVRS